MDKIELNKMLREDARSLGLCDEWYNAWKGDYSEKELAELMYKGLDFCIERHWPSNSFLKKHFSKDFLRSVNVFVDDTRSTTNPNESLALGNSSVTYRFNGWSIGIIYIRDNSKAKISAKGKSHVIAHLYEKASIEITKEPTADVAVIKHSPNVSVSGDVTKIRENL